MWVGNKKEEDSLRKTSNPKCLKQQILMNSIKKQVFDICSKFLAKFRLCNRQCFGCMFRTYLPGLYGSLNAKELCSFNVWTEKKNVC